MRTRLAILGCCAGLALLCAAAAPAEGDVFGPIALASAGATPGGAFQQQADSANDAAISGNGRFVAFDGSFAGRTGVFRRDLVTEEVATVAEGDAVLPSISEDGRYVSFTTTAPLDPTNDTNKAPDVYVRDMSNPSTQPCEGGEAAPPCSFALASAVNGSAVGLSYEYGSERPFEETHNGSLASGRSALSADGRRVAFETTAISNLANPNRLGSGTPEAPETPATQVAVRNLDTQTTTLVSVRYDPASGGPQLNDAAQVEPVPTSADGFGSIFPSGPQTPRFPSAYAGASLSADGSTVAWLGQQVGEQVPLMSGSDLAAGEPRYTEPLWRRIGEGERAPTRRVTGGSDPTSPQCVASGETQLTSPPTLLDPCQGPFDTSGGNTSNLGTWASGPTEDYLPSLSANGLIVGFLATARTIASGEEFKAGESSNNLYVVDMRDGLTRVAATRRLTELAGGNATNEALTAPILDQGVSPDGSQVAFTTKRTVFPLGSPSYVSVPAATVAATELYDVDLGDDTLTRVTQGYEGQPSEPTSNVEAFTGSPSFSDDGNLLTFSSFSDNLVYGDGNGNSDAFVIPRKRFPANPTAQEVSPAPASPLLVQAWQLQATALSRRDGSVLLEVLVPGAGTLRVGAQSAVRVRSATAHRAANRHRARRTRTTVATRTVSSAVVRPSTAGVQTMTLKLAHAYKTLASARGGLSATVKLVFSAAGHPTLHQSVAVSFARKPVKRARSRTAGTDRAEHKGRR
jgi:WD40-like Beta Propeller Repeat